MFSHCAAKKLWNDMLQSVFYDFAFWNFGKSFIKWCFAFSESRNFSILSELLFNMSPFMFDLIIGNSKCHLDCSVVGLCNNNICRFFSLGFCGHEVLYSRLGE